MEFSYLLIIFLLLVLIVEVLGTVSGFGSSLFFVPLASFFFDFHMVLALTAALHIMSNTSKVVLFRKGLDFKLILKVGIPSIVFVLIGALLTTYIVSQVFEIVLAASLMVTSIVFFAWPHLNVKPTWTNSLIGGSISGFLAGFTGTGGAIRGLLLSAFQLQKNTFVSNSAFIDFGVDITRGIVYFSNGYFQNEYIYLLPVLLIISFLGTYIGKKILHRMSETFFRKIVLLFIFITGVVALLKALGLL